MSVFPISNPISFIFMTSDRLYQFLKHLLDVGIKRLIRIGGRSEASELDSKNLRVVSKEIPKTRLEPEDLDGFITVSKDPLATWLGRRPLDASGTGTEAVSHADHIEQLTGQAEESIYSLTSMERWTLAENWLKQLRENQSELLFESVDQANRLRQTKDAVHNEVNRRALVLADIVGVTTSSLARNIDTLRRIGSKVIICEEAGEVKEPDLISGLIPGVEHLIQIGDHKQLRPQIANHSLSIESSSGMAWQLDRSQFERRAVGEPGLPPAPVAQLNIQRRMRPEISQLIRSVYPNLQDHDSVLNTPNVIGMRHNVFWLDHRCGEDTKNDGTRVKSHSNEWEAEMATALARHLVRQGEYKSNDIAVLTPYTGQLRKLRAALSQDFEIFISERDLETLALEGLADDLDEQLQAGTQRLVEKKQLLQTLRLATVDNFQGEEAKVIIVSLVRSNPAHRVGFLRTENRINVLLSRAQHGMYLIGNTETYLHVPMWADVHSHLVRAGAVNTALSLSCPRHPDVPIFCSEPADFARNSPEGGCQLPCDRRLEPCGHKCQAQCHSKPMHEAFACCVPGHAMREKRVAIAKRLVRFDVHTQPVPQFAARHARLVLRVVPGSAPTRAPAPCHVQLPATVFPVMNGVVKFSTVVTSAQASAKCGDKLDARVDLLEFKRFSEIDLDESPILVLACGHFFTGETLDGMVGVDEVYIRDIVGKFIGLRDVSAFLAGAVPSCPDCKRPIRQFVAKRYNRVINRAVMDETCKRFLVSGRSSLDELENRLRELDTKLDATRSASARVALNHDLLSLRHLGCTKLQMEALVLGNRMNADHQPAKKLIDAIFLSQSSSDNELDHLVQRMDGLKLLVPAPDAQLTLRARLIQIRAAEVMLRDHFALWKVDKRILASLPRDKFSNLAGKFLKDCRDLITQAKEANLSRVVIAATLAFAKLSHLEAWYYRNQPEFTDGDATQFSKGRTIASVASQSDTVRSLLAEALDFYGELENGDELRDAVQEMLRLSEGPRYEEVTPEELASIKIAMVSGQGV
ncbi:NFX1-type zinc finger-containing-like protein [Cladobotryum mycophilum]|uniref:NFX1-type zinc finger-containing-like protein n=1 Tax=Cladobotryum mycophilum TaxID=491253 RepID=A0ABR0SHP2_9HYPO